MPRYKRVSGGEKNDKSGKPYSKYELRFIRDLFLSLPDGVGVHENNPQIHHLSQRIGRLPRSIEGQMHMFKSLKKGGNHGWAHMSKNCREVWQEYLDKIN